MWPTIGFAMFAFGFSICLSVAVAYLTDCYHNVSGIQEQHDSCDSLWLTPCADDRRRIRWSCCCAQRAWRSRLNRDNSMDR